MPECTYTPQISAQFGKMITDEEIWREFQAIEEAMLCFVEAIGSVTASEDTIYDHGVVDNSYTINPAFGVIHYLEVQGDTNLTISPPEDGDPKLITLIIANAGAIETENYGRFNFKAGTVWSHDRDDVMDGKPWNMFANLTGREEGNQYMGFYGCAVQCIYDGTGWLHIVWARHHLNIFGEFEPDDIYDRR